MKKFKRGDEVEIIGKGGGFEGSYYEGVVISEIGSKYIVQYRTLVSEDKRVYRDAPLREFLSHGRIRPAPPQLDAPEFEISQRVDAYYNDGWWVGTLRAVNGSECVVHFSNKSTTESLKFEVGDLRIHQDWVGDQWVIPKKVRRGRPRKR